MNTSDFDFDLPLDRIAQRPLDRGSSRLLIVDAEGDDRHRRFDALPDLLREGDLLVVNDTRVVPARLLGRRRPGGGKAELLLVEPAGDGTWWALARPGRKLGPGALVDLGPPDRGWSLEAEVVEVRGDGRRRVRFSAPVEEWLDDVGQIPLPPYVERPADAEDRDAYQTVWARHPGAVAAPTAGLHFSEEILAALDARGVERASVTLHVGPGTFRPVKVERVEDHRMDEERWEVPPATAERITLARRRGGRVVAVGTTVVRTLESAARDDGHVPPGSGRTDLFLRPGSRFRAVDALVTNFHLPRSTLVMLVCAFAGRERVLDAYREAVRGGYRFYSYGDAMFLLHRPSP